MQLVEQVMQHVGTMTRTAIRDAILHTQRCIEESEHAITSESCPVQHFFAPGCYAREITMPEGMLVIGKIHKHAHVNVLSKGRVRVLTELGSEEFSAPRTFISEPYIKRTVLILEDAVWTTVHITNSTDLSEIEREVIATDYSEIELVGNCMEVPE